MTRNPVLFKVSEPRWSKAISRVKWIFNQYAEQRKAYGFNVAWYGLLWWFGVYSRLTALSVYSIKQLNNCLDAYFEKNYGDVVAKYRIANAKDNIVIPVEEYPIWVFWWQGEDKMPSVVRHCYERIKKNNPNVTLLNKGNLKQVIDLPDVIYEKVNNGAISYTHFSDILRLALLNEKGGMWVDATCFNPYAIPDYAKQQIFYSPHDKHKQEKLANKYMYWCDSGGWRSWNIGTNVINNPLFAFSKDLILALAIKESCFPNYFMVDCMISYAYRNFTWAKQMIDTMPDFNIRCADLFLSYFNTNMPYNEGDYQRLIKDDWMFKLTYKTVWLKEINGNPTFYGKLFSEL